MIPLIVLHVVLVLVVFAAVARERRRHAARSLLILNPKLLRRS